MGFQIGLNLPGAAFDAYLNPRPVPDLGRLGAGIGSALDEAVGKGDYRCSTGSCGHAGHRGGRKSSDSGGAFDVDEFGNLSQSDPDDLAASPPALFSGDTLGVDETRPQRREDVPAALDQAMESAPVEAEDPYTRQIRMLEKSLRPSRGVDAKTAKSIAAGNRSVMRQIATLTNQRETDRRQRARDAQAAEERAIDNARADEQLGLSRAHLDIALRGARRQEEEAARKVDLDAAELDDLNSTLSRRGLLPRDEVGTFESDLPTMPTAVDSPGFRLEREVPYRSAKVAKDVLDDAQMRERQEDTQAATAERQTATLASAERRAKAKAEISGALRDGRQTLAALKLEREQVAGKIRERGYALGWDQGRMAKDAEYQALLQRRDDLFEAAIEHLSGDGPAEASGFATADEARAAYIAERDRRKIAPGSPEARALQDEFKRRIRAAPR